MAKILILFSNAKYKDSAWRLKKQAKRLKMFDRIVHYQPKDLPAYITASPLMMYGRGAGCFIWKPYVIWHALKKANEGDIIFYADAGCRLNASPQWDEFLDLLQRKDAIFFEYRDDQDYGYAKKWANNSSRIKHWCKPSELEYFSRLFPDGEHGEFSSLWGGFMIFRKCDNTLMLVEEWLKIFLFYPALVAPPIGVELEHMPPAYNASRDDQPPLTFLVNYYRERLNLEVLPETSESHCEGCAVVAERFIEGNNTLLTSIKVRLHYLLFGNK